MQTTLFKGVYRGAWVLSPYQAQVFSIPVELVFSSLLQLSSTWDGQWWVELWSQELSLSLAKQLPILTSRYQLTVVVVMWDLVKLPHFRQGSAGYDSNQRAKPFHIFPVDPLTGAYWKVLALLEHPKSPAQYIVSRSQWQSKCTA